MTKEELALEVIARLKKEYPDAGCTLDYDQAWKLLVSVRLAAQCTDARVNVVVEELMRSIRMWHRWRLQSRRRLRRSSGRVDLAEAKPGTSVHV